MREKIKYYLNGVWGAEILIVVFLTVILGVNVNKALNDKFAQIGAGTFDALFNEEQYVKSMIYYESKNISENIYKSTDNLKNIAPLLEENRYIYDNELYNQYMYYIIFDKYTGNFTSNDLEFYEHIAVVDKNVINSSNDVMKYLKEKKYDVIQIDNQNRYNYYIESTESSNIKASISRYSEFYYKLPGTYNYLVKTEQITAQALMLGGIITILLTLKIIINILRDRKKVHWRINTLSRLWYVLRYGLKYRNTRNKILFSFGGAILVIVAYLYLVAGIRNQNVLVTFLTRYPFKGTLILVLIPLVCVIYSLKKSLDISIINDGLRKLNNGDLEYNINNVGEREVKELVENINKIKNGYKIAVDERVQNEKLKTELISNVSHDLKTPLTSIINYVNILKNKDITEQERQDYLKILEKKSLKLKTLIEDLFEVSKLNSGKMILEKNELDVVSLIHQVVGEYCTLYEEKNISFKVNSNVDEIFINIDGKLMSRVFENVIINSLKYSLDNTRVYIGIRDEENHVEIFFKNISNYEMDFNEEEIFERFVRADKSRNSAVEGSGIGLAIVKSIVELHFGDIKIEVEGDMFKIYIRIPKI
ncbi:sensor histidine kinase [Clostridium sp.]|uniref:sensor histidine kinase n=1 Tax=Clostridium sp. TaxID=1506 RepID=UPI003F398263